jgi:hypothetical protein
MGTVLAISALLCSMATQAPAPGGVLNLPLFHLPANGDAPYFWRGFCTDMARVTLKAGPIPADALPEGAAPQSCLQLGYWFPPPGKVDTAEIARWIELPECAQAVTMKLCPDGSSHALGLRLLDAEKETFQWRIGTMRLPTANTDNGYVLVTRQEIDGSKAVATWGGNADKVLDYPLSLQGLIIIREAAEPVQGQCGILSMEAEIPDPTIPVAKGGKAIHLLPLADQAHPWPIAQVKNMNADTADAKPDAEGALDVTYKWPKAQDDFSRVTVFFGDEPALMVPGRGTLLVRLEGDGSDTALFLVLDDPKEGRLFSPVAQYIVDFKGPGYVWLNTATPNLSRSGEPRPASEQPNYPLRLRGLFLQRLETQDWTAGIPRGEEGQLRIRDVWFLPEGAH